MGLEARQRNGYGLCPPENRRGVGQRRHRERGLGLAELRGAEEVDLHLDAAGHLPTPTEVAVTSIPARLEHLGEPFCREVVGLQVEEQVGLVGEAAGDRDASLGCGLDGGALVSSEGVQGDDVAPDEDGLVLEISELQEQRVDLVEDREEALFISH